MRWPAIAKTKVLSERKADRFEKANGNVKLELIRRAAAVPSIWPPVLFVHGGFHAAWCWDEHFLSYFAASGFEAVALSLRGHGGSDGHRSLKSYALSDYVEDVANVAATLHPSPILIGHSIGAVIVQQYVQSHAASAMVLLCPTPTGPTCLAAVKWFLRFPLRALWFLRFPLATFRMILTGDMTHALPSLRRLFFAPDLPAKQADTYMARMQRESPRVFDDISRIPENNPNASSVPTLVLIATHDGVTSRKTQELVKAFDAELAIFRTYHDVMLNPDWQIIASYIVNWLGRNVVPVRR
jgi:pimeloyl-ACP methyl ester carboxylesterase